MIDGMLQGQGSRNADLFIEATESELRKLDEDRADRDRAIADSLTDDDVALIFSGEFDIVPRRPGSRNKIHSYDGKGDGFTVTVDITVGVSGQPGAFTIASLEASLARMLGPVIGPSVTVMQARNNNADDTVVYEL